MVRERILKAKPPKKAMPIVEAWRSWVDERAGGLILDRLSDNVEDQEAFGKLLREVLTALELAEEIGQSSEENADSEDQEGSRPNEAQSEAPSQGQGAGSPYPPRRRRAKPPPPSRKLS